MKHFLRCLCVIMLLALTSCSMNRVTLLNDQKIDVSQIKEDISSVIAEQEEAKKPKTYTSYDDSYEITVHRKWLLEEKGALSNNENSIFELTGRVGGNRVMYCEVARSYDSISSLREEHRERAAKNWKEAEYKGIPYVEFSYAGDSERLQRDYCVFFVEEDDGAVLTATFTCQVGNRGVYRDDFCAVVDGLKSKNE